MAAPHSTDLSVPNPTCRSSASHIVPVELVGTGLYILMMFVVKKRVDGTGTRVTSRHIDTVALPLASLEGRHAGTWSTQGGAKC
jgi:hypothetical protein